MLRVPSATQPQPSRPSKLSWLSACVAGLGLCCWEGGEHFSALHASEVFGHTLCLCDPLVMQPLDPLPPALALGAASGAKGTGDWTGLSACVTDIVSRVGVHVALGVLWSVL